MSSFSICIPRVFNNISNQKIVGTFEKLQIGKVEKLDIVWKTGRDGSSFKMAFIHFSEWNMRSPAALKLREDIENPKVEAKLVYDDPWYWIVLPNNSDINKPPLPSNQTMSQSVLSDRIANLEEELSYIYEELYKREYIPVKYRTAECDWNSDIETGDMSPMTMTELEVDDDTELHTPPKWAAVHPYDDDKIDYYNIDDRDSRMMTGINSNWDNRSDIQSEFNENPDHIIDVFTPITNINVKLWMTANCCDNA